MAVSASFKLGSECPHISRKVDDQNGDVKMKPLIHALKLVRKETENVLTMFIEKESRKTAVNLCQDSPNEEASMENEEEDEAEEDDDEDDDDDDYVPRPKRSKEET